MRNNIMDPHEIHLGNWEYNITSDSGNSDLDEDYFKFQPPPEVISPNNVVSIEASKKSRRNNMANNLQTSSNVTMNVKVEKKKRKHKSTGQTKEELKEKQNVLKNMKVKKFNEKIGEFAISTQNKFEVLGGSEDETDDIEEYSKTQHPQEDLKGMLFKENETALFLVQNEMKNKKIHIQEPTKQNKRDTDINKASKTSRIKKIMNNKSSSYTMNINYDQGTSIHSNSKQKKSETNRQQTNSQKPTNRQTKGDLNRKQKTLKNIKVKKLKAKSVELAKSTQNQFVELKKSEDKRNNRDEMKETFNKTFNCIETEPFLLPNVKENNKTLIQKPHKQDEKHKVFNRASNPSEIKKKGKNKTSKSVELAISTQNQFVELKKSEDESNNCDGMKKTFKETLNCIETEPYRASKTSEIKKERKNKTSPYTSLNIIYDQGTFIYSNTKHNKSEKNKQPNSEEQTKYDDENKDNDETSQNLSMEQHNTTYSFYKYSNSNFHVYNGPLIEDEHTEAEHYSEVDRATGIHVDQNNLTNVSLHKEGTDQLYIESTPLQTSTVILPKKKAKKKKTNGKNNDNLEFGSSKDETLKISGSFSDFNATPEKSKGFSTEHKVKEDYNYLTVSNIQNCDNLNQYVIDTNNQEYGMEYPSDNYLYSFEPSLLPEISNYGDHYTNWSETATGEQIIEKPITNEKKTENSLCVEENGDVTPSTNLTPKPNYQENFINQNEQSNVDWNIASISNNGNETLLEVDLINSRYEKYKSSHGILHSEDIQTYLLNHKLLDYTNNYDVVTETYSFDNSLFIKSESLNVDSAFQQTIMGKKRKRKSQKKKNKTSNFDGNIKDVAKDQDIFSGFPREFMKAYESQEFHHDNSTETNIDHLKNIIQENSMTCENEFGESRPSIFLYIGDNCQTENKSKKINIDEISKPSSPNASLSSSDEKPNKNRKEVAKIVLPPRHNKSSVLLNLISIVKPLVIIGGFITVLRNLFRGK